MLVHWHEDPVQYLAPAYPGPSLRLVITMEEAARISDVGSRSPHSFPLASPETLAQVAQWSVIEVEAWLESFRHFRASLADPIDRALRLVCTRIVGHHAYIEITDGSLLTLKED